MADAKISDLPAASALDGTELALLSQSATDKNVALSTVKTYARKWQRPADWPARPSTASNQIVLLARVDNTSLNYAALTIAVSSGTYSVDWGDGTSSTGVASNTQSNVNLSYAGVSSSATSEGFKVAVVVVTTSGGNITTANFDVRHSSVGSSGYHNPWLEIEINASSLTAFGLGIGNTVPLRNLRNLIYTSVSTALTPTAGSNGIPNLKNVEFMANMCSTGTTVMSFRNCYNLEYIEFPENFGAAATTFAEMFNSCYSLRKIVWPSAFGSTSVTSLANMFSNCRALTELILPSGLGANSGCVNVSGVFNECHSLKTLTLPSDFGRYATTISSLFSNCQALTELTLPANFGLAVTNTANAFITNSALRSLNVPNLGTVATAGNYTVGSSGLHTLTGAFPEISFSIANCSLDAAALDAVYTALDTVTGQTITVSGNYGTAADDPTIATGKGWTVTG